MYRKGREFFRYYVIKDIFCTDFTFIMTNNRQQNPVFHIVKVIIFSLSRNENVRTVTDCVFAGSPIHSLLRATLRLPPNRPGSRHYPKDRNRIPVLHKDGRKATHASPSTYGKRAISFRYGFPTPHATRLFRHRTGSSLRRHGKSRSPAG